MNKWQSFAQLACSPYQVCSQPSASFLHQASALPRWPPFFLCAIQMLHVASQLVFSAHLHDLQHAKVEFYYFEITVQPCTGSEMSLLTEAFCGAKGTTQSPRSDLLSCQVAASLAVFASLVSMRQQPPHQPAGMPPASSHSGLLSFTHKTCMLSGFEQEPGHNM